MQRRQLAVARQALRRCRSRAAVAFAGSGPTNPCACILVTGPCRRCSRLKWMHRWCGSSCRRSPQGGALRPRPGRGRRQAHRKKTWLKFVAARRSVAAQAARRVGWDSGDLQESVPGDDLVDRLAVTAAAGLLFEICRPSLVVLGTAWQLRQGCWKWIALCARRMESAGRPAARGSRRGRDGHGHLRLGVTLQAKP